MADDCPVKTERGGEDAGDSNGTAAASVTGTDQSGVKENSVESGDDDDNHFPVLQVRDSGTRDIDTRNNFLDSTTPPMEAAAPVAAVTPGNCFNRCLTSSVVRSVPIPKCCGDKRCEKSCLLPQATVAPSVDPAASQSKCVTLTETSSRAKAGMHLNGLASVCSHSSGLVSSSANNYMSACKPAPAGSQMVHINGRGAFPLCRTSDDNLNLGTGSTNDASDQFKKGARAKKIKRRLRRCDRQAKTGSQGVVPSDSDEDDMANFPVPGSVSLVRPNVVACSHLNGRLGIASQCNGEAEHSRPLFSSSSFSHHHPHQSCSSEKFNEPLPPAPPPPPTLRDDDLVDEGAVCDFDRNVLTDENLVYAEDTSIPSPEDGAICNERSNFSNGHALLGSLHHVDRHGHRHYSCHRHYNLSDSEDDLFGRVPHVRAGAGWEQNGNKAEQDMEDTGDFIDADLPAASGQLSSSADSASLSSTNGDNIAEPIAPEPLLNTEDCASSQLENDLSGGSDKELNHNQDSPLPDSNAQRSSVNTIRTSYSSPSRDGVFDNFLLPRDLSSSDGVFWNSSESENEEELTEGNNKSGHRQEHSVSSLEGAGVAEALGDSQFGAGGGDLCFHFDRACCLPSPSPSSAPFQTGQSAARHCPHHLHHLPSPDLPSEGEAGGACAPPPPVNNLSRLHPATSGEAMANGLDDVAPSNFINDESNRQQKVFDKFPMVEEGRDGACGSGAGPGKCDNDNVLYPPCPVAPAPGIMYERPGDRGLLQGLRTMLEHMDESFRLQDYKRPFGDGHWKASSESGVSEPSYDESYGNRLCPSADCCMAYNSMLQSSSKGGKDTKKKQIVCRPIENGMQTLPSVDRIMIWSEYEAYLLQVKQIGMSACGQTAVLNLLKAFELVGEKEDVCNTIQVNMRKEKASVAEYLASRAIAGTTAEDLLSGVERLTKGEIRGRFFHMWPPRNIQLLTWLSQWMKRGAVPIATLNLQQGVKQQQIPDAWHHQMVYGVGPRGVYLTNPLEIVSEETMLEQLTSDSVLLVRRQDVVSRFQPTASLAPLLHHPDSRWCTMNVLGQVVNVLREQNMPSVPGYRAQVTSHIRIPAVYRAGITLYVRHNTAQWKALRTAPDLPLLSAPTESSQ